MIGLLFHAGGLIPAALTDIRWQPIVFHQKYLVSQAIWEIFQLVCHASNSEIQKRHSKVVTIGHCQLCSTLMPVVYFSATIWKLMCHNKFYGRYYGILRTCANSVYQVLPLIFPTSGYVFTCMFCIQLLSIQSDYM